MDTEQELQRLADEVTMLKMLLMVIAAREHGLIVSDKEMDAIGPKACLFIAADEENGRVTVTAKL